MQLADSPEMCSLNHFNSGHFLQVLGEAQVPGIQCLDPHASAGPGHSWLVGTARAPRDGNVSMTCMREEKMLTELFQGIRLEMYGMTQVHPASCPGKAPACTMPAWDVAVTAQAPGSGLTWLEHSRLWMLGNTKPRGAFQGGNKS